MFLKYNGSVSPELYFYFCVALNVKPEVVTVKQNTIHDRKAGGTYCPHKRQEWKELT